MQDYKTMISMCAEQEEKFQFEHFSREDALKIGLKLHENAKKQPVAVEITVNGMTLSVTNGSASSTIRLLANGVQLSSQSISFSGMVTFSDLSTSGETTINGDNITTGTIEAIDIYGCTIEGSTFQSVLQANGTVGGEIQFCYLNTRYVAGGIRLDDQGAGTEYERAYRMFIYTNYVRGVGFAMKLQSASGISVEADENVFLYAGTRMTIRGDSGIYLTGDVYVNGTLLQVSSS